MVTKGTRAAWGLAEAKARLSEVLEHATREPQVIKLTRGLTLVTRNVDDFEGCGIALIDPFDPS
jgi:hypothetical protein